MNEALQASREKIVSIGALLFERHLTDAAGGNISVRVGDLLVMSPAYAGAQRQWRLRPEEVLIIDLASEAIIDGEGKISREVKVHFALHRQFGDYGKAVIHCHARNMMVFAALAKPMPPVLEANLKFGECKVAQYAPSHSPNLAENIVAVLRGQEARIAKQAAGVIAPWHGLFLMGKDLDAAFDAVERFDTNARCILMGGALLGTSDMLAEQRQQMQEAIAPFGGDTYE